MIRTRILPTIGSLLVLLFLATGCAAPSPAGLADDEIISITANILAALDSGDYPAFTRDFSDEMLAAFPEDQFTQLRNLLITSSGNFVSTGKLSLSNQEEFALYRIRCTYQQEDVVVTVVFRIDGMLVEGLFFDSPNLRSAAK
jgi:hypothetical protein